MNRTPQLKKKKKKKDKKKNYMIKNKNLVYKPLTSIFLQDYFCGLFVSQENSFE
jgi:hypothetical protein